MMQRLTHRLKQSTFGQPPLLVRKFSSPGILHAQLEEEKLRGYSPDYFYPVRIGDVLRSRYQVVEKLGYGGHSTVWLCRDLQ